MQTGAGRSRWLRGAPLALGSYGVAVCAYLILSLSGGHTWAGDAVVRTLAPLGALASCLIALLALPPAALAPWSLVCASALCAAAGARPLREPVDAMLRGHPQFAPGQEGSDSIG